MSRARLFFTALGLSISAAILFGLVFDQVSVRNAPAYFTLGHPIRPAWLPDPAVQPTLVGLYWGVAATWWVGAGLGLVHGLVLIICNPRVSLHDLILRHLALVLSLWALSLLVFLTAPHVIDPQDYVSTRLQQILNLQEVSAYAQNAVTHRFAYQAAAWAGLILCLYALIRGWIDQKTDP